MPGGGVSASAATNVEELLHDWLAELLYTFHARRLVLAEFQVQVGRRRGLTATARGEPIDPNRHEIDDEVKAITWCGLKVEQRADGVDGGGDCGYLVTVALGDVR